MIMKTYYFAAAILTVLLSVFSFSQEPVLFDGTNPVVLSLQGGSGQSATSVHDSIPQSQLVTPAELARSLQSDKQKVLILNIGPRSMYTQAHIPGAEYMGAGASDATKKKLRERVKALPKDSAIVLYCGCCPWSHCPNVQPAYELLHSMGYSNVKVIYITGDFGSDWVDKGYPVAHGE
jgi:rhodanese-related sulfurtransferase